MVFYFLLRPINTPEISRFTKTHTPEYNNDVLWRINEMRHPFSQIFLSRFHCHFIPHEYLLNVVCNGFRGISQAIEEKIITEVVPYSENQPNNFIFWCLKLTFHFFLNIVPIDYPIFGLFWNSISNLSYWILISYVPCRNLNV